jgi:hypothetical protein
MLNTSLYDCEYHLRAMCLFLNNTRKFIRGRVFVNQQNCSVNLLENKNEGLSFNYSLVSAAGALLATGTRCPFPLSRDLALASAFQDRRTYNRPGV